MLVSIFGLARAQALSLSPDAIWLDCRGEFLNMQTGEEYTPPQGFQRTYIFSLKNKFLWQFRGGVVELWKSPLEVSEVEISNSKELSVGGGQVHKSDMTVDRRNLEFLGHSREYIDGKLDSSISLIERGSCKITPPQKIEARKF